MSAPLTNYPCSSKEITCENKGPQGENIPNMCGVCQNYYRTAIRGYGQRVTFDGKDEQWAKAYALVDKLSAIKEHSHITYLFFHAVHWATSAHYGRKFSSVVKFMRHVFTAIQSYDDALSVLREWRKTCQCKTWCGRKTPQDDCDCACTLVASRLVGIRLEAGQEALDTALELLNTFAAMPGMDKKSVFTACDTIMGCDWFACAGQGQQKQKSVTGMEISLVWRVSEMVNFRKSLGKGRQS